MMKLIKPGLTCFFLLALFHTSIAQTRTITGIVTDSIGNPLAGATVSAKDSKEITLTNLKGEFSLRLPEHVKALAVSYIGMAALEVPFGSKAAFTIVLKPAGAQLGDVVVVGYGTARKANLTTAQTSVSAAAMEKTVNTTLEQALQGRAAGVYVTQNSGQPGGGLSVNIRGIGSLNRTQPLYVIDGVQIQAAEDVSYGDQSSSNPLAGLNPADIEDMQILQGPSATAIYGSRGTNGVILITTKHGKAGDFKVNYAYQYNLQTPPKSLDVMNLRQYAQMVNDYQYAMGTPQNIPENFLDPSILGKGTDWQKELFRNAGMNKHQLSVSGGSGNTTYYMSGEYLDQDGVAQGSGFNRYGFRLNLDNKPRQWLTLGANLSFNQTNEVLTATNYSASDPLIANALRLTPQIPVKNLDGTWGGSDEVNGAGQYAPVNPIAIASLITNKNMKRQFMGGLNVAVSPVKGLTVRTSFNTSMGNGLSMYYTPTYEIDEWHKQTINSLVQGTNSSWYWNWNELAEYNRQFGKHSVGLMVSHEAQESQWKNVTATRTGFLTNDVFDLDAGDPLTATNSGGTYPWSMESYLGRLSYNYDNRYILTATYRRDGSPFFGQDKRWGNFPSVSAAWRVSQEKFFHSDLISDLKLRLETGLTGNQGTGSGIYAAMASGATIWGTGFLPSTFTNPDLQWEETNTNNIGFNLGLWKDRLTAEADYYVKKTDNLIMQASLPQYMGINDAIGAVSAPLVNTGSLKTTGWNLTFNAVIIQKKDFKWESNLNLSHFKTVVTALNSDNAFIDRASDWIFGYTFPWVQRAAIGDQPWLFRGYIAEGLFQSVKEIDDSPVPVDGNGDRRPTANSSDGIWVGDVKYKDVNGDGVITADDQTHIGNPWPKLSGGFTNSFSYKDFELSILITGVYGNDVYNAIRQLGLNPNNVYVSRNFFTEMFNSAKLTGDAADPSLENPGATIPRITATGVAADNNQSVVSTRFVESGSYVRLKNISLSYSLPSRYLGYIKFIRGLKVGASIQNLLTITKYKGYDPEVGAYTGSGASSSNQAIGLDYGRYPLSPMYAVNVSVNF
ncbi:SusC/RagA family TonB-linked outer membrane protein [Parafilimonas sp.]|uniref:SusC/RagA family TonB-linked outer membrane protein n=1 Tax=Parafilimonas sp. TaxID=1969739 RepID=UPI0039E5D0B0